ncbi:MAG: SOUL family heme-binding protein [Micrococcales bacterium]
MTEQQPFDILAKHGDVEIRRYPAYVLVQAKSRGEFMRAGNQAFSPLLSYISGSNAGGQKISMTAPVLQSTENHDEHTVSFVMPAGFKPDSSAQPLSRELTVVEVDGHFAAAIRFKGSWDAERFEAMGQELMRRVHELGLQPLGELYWARFDPPFKPGFMKRNEAIVKIAQPSKEIH